MSWMVHVTFMDGSTEEVRGDPEITDGVLLVQKCSEDGRETVEFEAGFPLQHVKWWWVDYGPAEDDDSARSGPGNAGLGTLMATFDEVTKWATANAKKPAAPPREG